MTTMGGIQDFQAVEEELPAIESEEEPTREAKEEPSQESEESDAASKE